jgi:hypothetical protein
MDRHDTIAMTMLDALEGKSLDQITDDARHSAQMSMVETCHLPSKITHGSTQEMFEALGFVFGDQVDRRHRKVILPKRWTMVPTSSPTLMSIEDEKGRLRVRVHEIADFWDPYADMSLYTRFHIDYYAGDDYPIYDRCQGDKLIAKSNEQEAAEAWLQLHFPEWKDPSAYWGAPEYDYPKTF